MYDVYVVTFHKIAALTLGGDSSLQALKKRLPHSEWPEKSHGARTWRGPPAHSVGSSPRNTGAASNHMVKEAGSSLVGPQVELQLWSTPDRSLAEDPVKPRPDA